MDTIESEEKIVWSNGMTYLAESNGFKTIEVPIAEIYVEDGSTLNPWRHGFGNLGQAITYVSEKRPLFFFGVAGAVITIIGLIFGANVLYVANAGSGVAVGSALEKGILQTKI